ncbi:MAG: hypothetical protein JOZ92_02690, partial [Candidatus Dormibacteraeota bacterium]|nr:hypothetical protein [Candidatus Dormibacteraeota bacterium]
IGTATPAGTQSLSSGVWTVQAGGGDIWGTADSFRYIWKSMTGDGSPNLRVASWVNQSTGNAWAKAGLMVRSVAGTGGATDPGAPYYAVLDTGDNGVVVQYRTTEGGASSQIDVGGTQQAPVYVEIVRSDGGGTGLTFTGYYSLNGSTWTAIAGSTLTIPALSGTLAEGMATTSHNQSALTQVSFDNLNLP